jgi:hypothetical protein
MENLWIADVGTRQGNRYYLMEGMYPTGCVFSTKEEAEAEITRLKMLHYLKHGVQFLNIT